MFAQSFLLQILNFNLVPSRSPSKMASSSCDRVLEGVPELLEKILFELPPRDLLLAQRVSKTFRDNIQASTRYVQEPVTLRDAFPIS